MARGRAPPPVEPVAHGSAPIFITVLVCWILPIILSIWTGRKAKAQHAAAKAQRAAVQAKAAADLKSKTYLVVGASSGLGLELTKQLAARGSKVYATCRNPSVAIKALVARKGNENVTLVPNVDITSDKVGKVLADALKGVTIDVLVHNAGSYDGGVGKFTDPQALFASQKLDAITMETMKAVFEVNTFGALRVCKALHSSMASPGGKIAIVSTQLGSIDDNTSGGSYAYRSSKAALNMIGKSLSCDLKEKGVAVQLLAPGFVATSFGPGVEAMKKMGAKDVEPSVVGIVEALDAMGMESTGCFMHTNYGLGLKKSAW